MIEGHNSTALLTVENLTKRYGGEVAAIDRVAFSAVAGEILGVIGPNGAGKTPLLEAMAGLLSVDAGEILWCGEPLGPTHRRDAMFYLPDAVRPYRDQSTW